MKVLRGRATGAVAAAVTIAVILVVTHDWSQSSGPIGLGATRASWDAHHTPDENFTAGTAYDPTPGLGIANGTSDRYNDRYVSVDPTGQVLNYQMQLYPGTSIREARAEARREFPADMRVVSFKVRRECAQEVVASKDVFGFVEFAKNATAGSRYDPNDVAWMLLAALPRGTSPPAC